MSKKRKEKSMLIKSVFVNYLFEYYSIWSSKWILSTVINVQIASWVFELLFSSCLFWQFIKQPATIQSYKEMANTHTRNKQLNKTQKIETEQKKQKQIQSKRIGGNIFLFTLSHQVSAYKIADHLKINQHPQAKCND